MARRKALVAGALGIVGSNVAQYLHSEGWDVVGVSRSRPKYELQWRLVALDLADAAACRRFVAAEPDITHLFYAARSPRTQPAEEAAANLGMLVHLMEPLQELASGFQHVCLVHGTKWYGAHLGPFRTPAKEDDARHLPPNFYYDQADYVEALQKGKHFTWSGVRPALVCGFSLGYPHSVIAVLAAYTAISKALGLPLRFPGTQACFDAVTQATDVSLLARAMVWMATEPKCANQHLNVMNGDVFRWRNVWDRLARQFGMENGGVQTVTLSTIMADKEPLWRSIVERHGLRPLALSEIVNWNYGDVTFRNNWDNISSTLKARRLGLDCTIDSEEMLLELVQRFRDERIVP
jgi:nucleoside-diphosphate-sugar epimerase